MDQFSRRVGILLDTTLIQALNDCRVKGIYKDTLFSYQWDWLLNETFRDETKKNVDTSRSTGPVLVGNN